jgi:purine nucleosidase/pyrimidine-specific ribonucleoside hydrolase
MIPDRSIPGCRPIRLLIDTDPGIDDALALLLALGDRRGRVEAVTTVSGNVGVDLATRNLARILGAAAPEPFPRVARGAARPRCGEPVTAGHVHGADGLGDLSGGPSTGGPSPFPEAALGTVGEDAAGLIVATARRLAGELTIVALGPLTNLAVAVERDRDALARVGRVVVMGGAIAVPGNVTPVAEFNVFVDPEAAALVLAAGLPLTLVPLDVTARVAWEASWLDRLPQGPDGAGRLATALLAGGLALGAARGASAFALHDPLAVGVALEPSLVVTCRLPVAVETVGALTRGMTVADRRRRPAAPATCEVALEVDAARFLARFEEVLWGRSA